MIYQKLFYKSRLKCYKVFRLQKLNDELFSKKVTSTSSIYTPPSNMISLNPPCASHHHLLVIIRTSLLIIPSAGLLIHEWISQHLTISTTLSETKTNLLLHSIRSKWLIHSIVKVFALLVYTHTHITSGKNKARGMKKSQPNRRSYGIPMSPGIPSWERRARYVVQVMRCKNRAKSMREEIDRQTDRCTQHARCVSVRGKR